MANDSNAVGEVPILITGDYSDLQADFDGAARVAESSSAEIQSSIDKAAQAPDVAPITGAFEEVGTSATEAGGHAATMADDVTASADQSGAAMSEAGGSAEVMAESISSASSDASSAMSETGGASEEMAGAISHAGAEAEGAETGIAALAGSITQFADHAHEATGGITEFLASIGELAEIGIAGIAIGELGKEAIDASSGIERARISLTALTGSSAEAADIIEKLEEVAKDQALSFPALLTAGQRMVAFLGPDQAGKVPEILSAIADGAAATNSSIEKASNAFDRITAAGQVSARFLLALGITLPDLAKAMADMGVATDGTQKSLSSAFQEMSQTDRVEALTTALGKFSGLSEQLAATIPGQWAIIGNQLHEIFVDLGNIIGPVLTPILQALGVVLGGLGTVIHLASSEWAELTGKTHEAAAASSSAGETIQGTTQAVAEHGAAHKQAAGAIQQTTETVKTTIDAHGQAKTVITDTTAAVKGHGSAHKATTANINDATQAVKTTIDAHGQAKTVITETTKAVKDHGAAQQSLALDFRDTKLAAVNIDEAFYELQKATGFLRGDIVTLSPAMQDIVRQFGAGAESSGDAVSALRAMMGIQQQVTSTTLEFADSINQASGTTQRATMAAEDHALSLRAQDRVLSDNAQSYYDAVDAAIAYVDQVRDGTMSVRDAKTAIEKLSDAQTQATGVASDLGSAFSALADDAAKTDFSAIDSLPSDLTSADAAGKNFSQHLSGYMDVASESSSKLGNTLTSGIGSAINSVIDGTKGMLDAFESAGIDIGKTIVDDIIKGGLDPMISSLSEASNSVDSLMSDVSGGSGGGGIFSAIGDVVGGGIGNVLGGIGGFVTGIIGDIQGAHQSNVLGEIEINTRGTLAEALNMRADVWAIDNNLLQKLDSLWSTLRDIFSAVSGGVSSGHGGGSGSVSVSTNTANGQVTITAPITINGGQSNAADIAQEVARYLLSLSPRFAVSF